MGGEDHSQVRFCKRGSLPCVVGTFWLIPSTADPHGYFSISHKVLLWVPGFCYSYAPDNCAVLLSIY